jgi:hypothetical protein
VQQAVEDRIGERWIADLVMPVLGAKLAGDERGAGARAIAEHFEQISACAGSDGRDGEVVDDEELGLGQRCQAFAEIAVGIAEREFP